jgi:sugar phosphate permease
VLSKDKSNLKLSSVFTDKRVIGLAGLYMMASISIYGVSYWLPTVVKGFGVTNTINGLLNILPWLAATIVLAWLPSKLRKDNRALMAMLTAASLGVIFFLGSVFCRTTTGAFSPCAWVRRACTCCCRVSGRCLPSS